MVSTTGRDWNRPCEVLLKQLLQQCRYSFPDTATCRTQGDLQHAAKGQSEGTVVWIRLSKFRLYNRQMRFTKCHAFSIELTNS